ncbi:MAG: HemK2/MTQ2 family protein methyltransferase [Candidatus Micrarchaeota archaeon]
MKKTEKMLFAANGIEILLVVPDNVYLPSDDTQMLAESALKECEGEVIEIGCGSGAVSIILAKEGKCRKIIAMDINGEAIKAAKNNAKLNNVSKTEIEFADSDLFENISKNGKFDYILFNPPYLPTTKKEKIEGKLNFAFDGGKYGVDVIEKFLKEAKKHLKKDGKILMVGSLLQPNGKIKKIMQKNCLKKEIIATKSFFFEKLYVYRITTQR